MSNLITRLLAWLNPWRAEVMLLRSELDRLRATIADPFITGLHICNGTAEVEFGDAFGAKLLAGMFLGMFDKHPGDAKNYIEVTFSTTLGPLLVTVQHPQGMTPHQLRLKAEARIAEVKSQRDELLSSLGWITEYIYEHEDWWGSIDEDTEENEWLSNAGNLVDYLTRAAP